MKHPIFFSWQSDTLPVNGRNLIQRALERALTSIGVDTEIEAAAVFVADLTFAGRRPDGAPIPNPNVLIEYGWALKALGHSRIVSVMNTAYGNPAEEQMPFDMRHLRHPIQYLCPLDADEAMRTKVRAGLATQLEQAIRAVISTEELIPNGCPATAPCAAAVPSQRAIKRPRPLPGEG